MSKLTIPKNYSSALNLHDTQLAIKTVKDFFQGTLAQRLSDVYKRQVLHCYLCIHLIPVKAYLYLTLCVLYCILYYVCNGLTLPVCISMYTCLLYTSL